MGDSAADSTMQVPKSRAEDAAAARLLQDSNDANRSWGSRVIDSMSIYADLPSNACQKAAQHVQENPMKVGEQLLAGAAVAAVFACAIKNPAAMGKRFSAGLLATAESSTPVFAGLATLDWGSRVVTPGMNVLAGGDKFAAHEQLGKNVGSGLVDYAASTMGGALGASIAWKLTPRTFDARSSSLSAQDLACANQARGANLDADSIPLTSKVLSEPFNKIESLTPNVKAGPRDTEFNYRHSDKPLELQQGEVVVPALVFGHNEPPRAIKMNALETDIELRITTDNCPHGPYRITGTELAGAEGLSVLGSAKSPLHAVKGDVLDIKVPIEIDSLGVPIWKGEWKVLDVEGAGGVTKLYGGNYKVSEFTQKGVVLSETYANRPNDSFFLPHKDITESGFFKKQDLNVSKGDVLCFPDTRTSPTLDQNFNKLKFGSWTVADTSPNGAVLVNGTRMFAVPKQFLAEPYAYHKTDWLNRSTSLPLIARSALSAAVLPPNQLLESMSKK